MNVTDVWNEEFNEMIKKRKEEKKRRKKSNVCDEMLKFIEWFVD